LVDENKTKLAGIKKKKITSKKKKQNPPKDLGIGGPAQLSAG